MDSKKSLFSIHKCLLCVFILCAYSFGDDFSYDSLQTKDLNTSTQNTYYQPSNKYTYLALSSGIILGGTLVGAGVLYLMPESYTNWKKDEIVNLGSNWKAKVSRAPVVDGDDWFLNWITHPYWGAVYYMQPRMAGFSWAESAFYSILTSAFFWEYGIEAFAETPSWQDLVITPAIGSIFGELFYRATIHIQSNQNTLLGSRLLAKGALIFMDPVGYILQNSGMARFFGVENKADMQSFIMPLSTNGTNGVQFKLIARF